MTIVISCAIVAHGDPIGDGVDPVRTCIYGRERKFDGGVTENEVGSHDETSFLQQRLEFRHRALGDQVEVELPKVVAKFERLGYPPDVLARHLKEKIKTMSLSDLQAARLGLSTAPMEPECVAARVTAATAAEGGYRFVSHSDMMAGHAARVDLANEGYTFVRSFNNSVGKDWDYMSWWEKDGNCMFAFRDSHDKNADVVNNWDPTPITKWGVDGVHRGLVKELDGLLSQVDFGVVKAKCSGSVTVAGHSLGGGLAQFFALVINQRSDVLGANLSVDALYTFGAMSLGEENERNDKAGDGCFGGRQFVNAREDETGIAVDIVTTNKTSGQVLEPVMSSKELLFAPGSSRVYKCGETIPKVHGSSGFDLRLLQQYEYNLGCISALELWADELSE